MCRAAYCGPLTSKLQDDFGIDLPWANLPPIRDSKRSHAQSLRKCHAQVVLVSPLPSLLPACEHSTLIPSPDPTQTLDVCVWYARHKHTCAPSEVHGAGIWVGSSRAHPLVSSVAPPRSRPISGSAAVSLRAVIYGKSRPHCPASLRHKAIAPLLPPPFPRTHVSSLSVTCPVAMPDEYMLTHRSTETLRKQAMCSLDSSATSGTSQITSASQMPARPSRHVSDSPPSDQRDEPAAAWPESSSPLATSWC